MIIAKTAGENLDLVEAMRKLGLASGLVKGGTRTVIGAEYKAVIPEELIGIDHELHFNINEEGGGTTNNGFAQVICGVNGGKLTPHEIKTTGHLCNGIHAVFETSSCCVIKYTRGTHLVKIVNQSLDHIDEQNVRIAAYPIWDGDLSQLPKTYSVFEQAVLSAVAKAHNYHCREPYFINKG